MMRFLIYRESSSCWVCCELDASNGFFGCEWSGKPYGNPLIENMTNFQNDLMLNTSTSPAQSFVSEDAGNIPSARARVLGGGSSLIAGFFTYSSPEYVASMGWDGKLVNESYTWVTPIIAEIPELQNLSEHRKSRITGSGCGTWQRRYVPAFDQYQSWRLHLRPHWPSSHCRWSSTILRSWSHHCSSVGLHPTGAFRSK